MRYLKTYYQDYQAANRAGYEELLAKQGGVCAICFQDEPLKGGLRVDHGHETGAVRGLLCNSCNNGLGRFKDDPERLHRAAAYLVKDTQS